MIETSKKLLDTMGIPYVQAPSEGEAQTAHMCKRGEVWTTGSQDYDALLFGSPKVVRNLNISGRRKVPGREAFKIVNPEIIDLNKVLLNLGLDQEKLIILGILVGTDYNPGGVKGIGPKKGLELVRSKKISEIFKEFEWNFKMEPESILNWFKNPDVTDEYNISRKKPDEEQVIKFLCDENAFSVERVKSGLSKLEKPPQSNLQSFFN